LVCSEVGVGLTVMKNMGKTNPMMHPIGPASDPIVVAIDLS